ncbi:MAG TPA: (d)CMP kinase [Methylomirabilota bacterium]
MITIDGPAGAGKSTVAREVARRLRYRLLDTGAMYRALAWSVEQAGLPPADTPALRRHLEGVTVDVREDGISVDGRDVTAAIRSPAISTLTSQLTTLVPVRQKVTPIQRRLAGAGGAILEGRDTGTVVWPEAEVKFYLDADLDVRARRRQAEFKAKGVEADFEVVRAEIAARDIQDMQRTLAPLRAAADAIKLDTTHMSIDEVVEAVLAAVGRQRCSTRS